MKIGEIIRFLEQWAPSSLQEGYDNSGLITGDRDWDLEGILLCLDSTEAVIEEAIQQGANLVIAHHPIVFSGLKKFSGGSYVERSLIKAIKNEVAIYAIHTNLDHIGQGVNAMICGRLGLNEPRILKPLKGRLKKLFTFCPASHADAVRKALFEAGAGHIGNYDSCSFNTEGTGTFRAGEGSDPFVGEIGELHRESEWRIETIFPDYAEVRVLEALLNAHPYEEVAYDIVRLDNAHPGTGAGMIGVLNEPLSGQAFLEHVKKAMRCRCIRHTALSEEKIRKVAVCGGSGSFLLKEAIGQGADALVTADFKYHQFFDADGQILIADIGHYESEQFTPHLLEKKLREKFPTFAVCVTGINTNPVNYF